MDEKTTVRSRVSTSALGNEGQALVLSGGGARAAYQVGCLRVLAQSLPDYRPQILTGVSAGAINATHLAAFQRSWQESVEALAVVTTNYTSGRSEAWVDTLQEQIWSGSQVTARRASLTLEHVMASAALPFFFPSVKLQHQWHGDGGIRLAAPLSPAMRLGATRILAVSPRTKPQIGGSELPTNYPSPGQVAGVMLNAVFLDLLDFDALQMQRMNDLLRRIPPQQWGRQRPVDVMVLRPRADLGKIARQSRPQMPGGFRFFSGGFSGRDEPTADALSMVNFEPGYIGQLIEFGEQDTLARMDEIEAFLRG